MEEIKRKNNANVADVAYHGIPDEKGLYNDKSAGYLASIGRIDEQKRGGFSNVPSLLS